MEKTIEVKVSTILSGSLGVLTLLASLSIAIGAYKEQNIRMQSDLEEAKKELKLLNNQVPTLSERLAALDNRLDTLGGDVRSLRDAIMEKKK